jgi:pimeloyl-ACP methyl ester carboxylesterase
VSASSSKGRARGDAAAEHVTPYDRIAGAWTDTEVERLLASGEQRQELTAYFGEGEYRDLARLATAVQRTRRRRGRPRVIIVPGIMGSQLGLPRSRPLPHDVVWLDPVDISSGRLTTLRLPGSGRIRPLGVVLHTYLRLKLHLTAAGFDPVFHDYDWRLGVDEVGRELARRVHAEPHDELTLVAHSMGGLVSRAALNLPGTNKVARVVLVGTPNHGSFAAVQALRGTYSVVRKIARLDASHSAESLASEVFNTFPSLYQMLPGARRGRALDLLDASQWPRSGPQPCARQLEAARALGATLAAADERFAVVAGVQQETVTGVARRGDDFVYTVTRNGDGTVPTAYAELAGARTYYARVSHSELVRNGVVAHAIADLLRTGRTRRLPHTWPLRGSAAARVTDAALRRNHSEKVDWAALEPDERRIYLQNLNEPPQLRLRARKSRRRLK